MISHCLWQLLTTFTFAHFQCSYLDISRDCVLSARLNGQWFSAVNVWTWHWLSQSITLGTFTFGIQRETLETSGLWDMAWQTVWQLWFVSVNLYKCYNIGHVITILKLWQCWRRKSIISYKLLQFLTFSMNEMKNQGQNITITVWKTILVTLDSRDTHYNSDNIQTLMVRKSSLVG